MNPVDKQPISINDPDHPEHHDHVIKLYGPFDRVVKEVPEIPDIDYSVFSSTTKMMATNLVKHFDSWVKLPLIFDEHESHDQRITALKKLKENGFNLTADNLDATRFGANKMGGVISFTVLLIDSLSSHPDLYEDLTEIWEGKLYKKEEYDNLPTRSKDGNSLTKEKIVEDLEERVLTIMQMVADFSHGILAEHREK